LAIDERAKEEYRKIQFSGKSSYVLALPKKWVEEMKLRAGDQVAVLRQGDTSLMITPKVSKPYGSKAEAVVEISPGAKASSSARRLISVYLLGYSVIHVKGKEGALTSNQRNAIKEVMRRHLIGTEIISESNEGITLQVLLSYPDLSVKSVVKRMFLITTAMHKDVMDALKDFTKDSATGIMNSDDEVDRFSLYAIRQLNIAVLNELILKEVDLATRRDCLDYRLIVKAVERVADHASRIAEAILLLEAPVTEPLLSRITKMSEFAVDLFEKSGLALFKGDADGADSVVEQSKMAAEMQKEILGLIAKKNLTPGQVIPLIVEDLRRTAEYAADIAEIVINMGTEKAVLKEGSFPLAVF
jgi:phosphate uptake regulator